MSDKVNNSQLILIVEDSAVQAAMLKRFLTQSGYEVAWAENGAEGLRAARELHPDLVITDIMMPVLDGFEMCKELKHDASLGNIPVILLTNLTDVEDIIKALDAGADTYISKPYRQDYLLAKVSSILGGSVRFKNKPQDKLTDISYAGKDYTVRSGREQALSLLLSTYENAIDQNRELLRLQEELKSLNEQLENKVIERTARLSEEELKTEAIVASMGDGLSIQDTDYRIIFQNRILKEMIGDQLGKYCYKAYEQREDICEGCPLLKSFEDGAVHRAERRGITDRGDIYVEVTSSPLKDAAGKIIGGIEIVRDITGRRRMEEALRESEKSYRNLVDNAAVGVYRSSLKGDILFVNKALARMYEFESPEEMITSGALARYKVPEDRERLLDSLLKNNKVDNFEVDMVTKTGKVKHLLFNATLEGGVLSGMVLDITEKNKLDELIKEYSTSLEEEVRSRTLQLENANKDLESFSYSVSHDLKAPLRAIDGFSGIISEDYRDRLDDEGRRLLNVVRENARKMGRLIDDILAFSRAGRKELEIVKVDMERLVREVIDEVRPAAADRNIRFEVKPLPPVMGDRAALRQVFVNLVANAVKFTRAIETAVIEIGATDDLRDTRDETRETRYEIVYYVKDNGVGFDMQYADKLFGVFSRLHSEEAFEGTGIGLAIVKRIIEKHGGRIRAEGKVGEGAVFYFSLPAGMKK